MAEMNGQSRAFVFEKQSGMGLDETPNIRTRVVHDPRVCATQGPVRIANLGAM